MAKNIVADLPPDPATLDVGDFWTDTGGTGGNQLYVWQGDYFVSASGSADQDVTTADVMLTNPQTREGETTQEDANVNFHTRLSELERTVGDGTTSWDEIAEKPASISALGYDNALDGGTYGKKIL